MVESKPGERLVLPDDTQALRQEILGLGISAAGFGDVREGLARDLGHLPTAIALGLAHRAPAATAAAYDHTGGDGEARLLAAQRRVVARLRAAGFRYLAIPPDSHRDDRRFVARLYPLFAHKTAGTCAGLGWVGRSGLLIHPIHGPRMTWATVLTDAPLAVDAPIRESRCGECTRCVQACPAGAIRGQAWVRGAAAESLLDAEACAGQLEANRRRMGLAACGHCLTACPFGKRRPEASASPRGRRAVVGRMGTRMDTDGHG